MLEKSRGIIILTDPDWTGKKIRHILTNAIPSAKQAYVKRDLATKNGDIGVENASKEEIIRALNEAKAHNSAQNNTFTKMDIYDYGLSGRSNSKLLRKQLCNYLGVDYMNSKSLLSFLNSLEISKNDLEKVLRECEKMNERLYSPKKIKEVINEENFNFSKALGQNFLIDGNFVRKIADLADIGKDDTVIEIGLGIGTLTEELLLRAKKVIGIELDKRLIPILEKTLEGFDNFELISGDALKIDFSEFFKSGENIKLVSNLPYNVGTPILTRILGNRYPFESLTIMLQKEVVDRITAKFSDKNYSSLTILCNYFARVQDGFIIPKTVFMPMPKIDSKVIRLDLKNEEKKPYEDILFELVRAGFNKRRKTILNSLQTKSYNKEIIEKALDNLDIPKNLRAENLSLQQYESISKFIYENI